MHIAVLTFKISLPGCRSLKEKRQRMGGLHERVGRNPAVAVCESGGFDQHESSEWTFVVTALSRQKLDSTGSEIENKLQQSIDGRVLEVTRELL